MCGAGPAQDTPRYGQHSTCPNTIPCCDPKVAAVCIQIAHDQDINPSGLELACNGPEPVDLVLHVIWINVHPNRHQLVPKAKRRNGWDQNQRYGSCKSPWSRRARVPGLSLGPLLPKLNQKRKKGPTSRISTYPVHVRQSTLCGGLSGKTVLPIEGVEWFTGLSSSCR